ncbi:hypothetical protein AAFF_G00031720 [Aldrovandia affinis]|uniref:Uncharacterized protein n=1 Tax=Aldrovandia affinis TaxID=143900 RepID=A0AAD7S3W6_9TELE|nr:hypothetical protein AAFF_G00031720 [Aldrovandia affinis]
MGQQVGRVGEGASAGLPPPQPQPQGRTNRGSSAGRRPREATATTGTPPGRAVAVNVPDPGINIFTQHSVLFLNALNDFCKPDLVFQRASAGAQPATRGRFIR